MQALIIDDSRAMRRIIAKMLTELDIKFVEAENGKEALEALMGKPLPDVALVDWNMPVMNGLEFVRAVRADARFESLPLMMVTTETEVEHVVLALQAGANEYLMKPFERDSMAVKLQMMGLL